MTLYPYPQNFDEEFIKKREEKRKIRRAANLTGVVFLMMTAIMIFWSYPVRNVCLILGVNMEKVISFLSNTTVVQVIQIFVSTIAFTLPYLLYTRMMKTRVSETASLKGADSPKLILPFILIGLGMCGFSNFVTNVCGNILEPFMNMFDYSYVVQDVENPTNVFGIILSFLATAVFPPLVEEFAMRGVVLGSLRRFGDEFAIVASSLLFGLMHGNFIQIPFAFLLGLIFGYAVIKTGTIWTAVVIHFINNLMSISFEYLLSEISELTYIVINTFYLIVLIGLGFVGLLMLNRRGGGDFSTNNNTELLKTGEKIKTFLTAPCIIIVYIVVVYESLFVYV